MNATTVIELMKELQGDDLVFAYIGNVSHPITHEIIELTQLNIDSKGNFIKLKNKISFLMAECYQNVIRHGKHSVDPAQMDSYSGGLFVRSIKESFYIASANTINNDVIPSIIEKLEKVNSLNTDELRQLQKQVLTDGKLSDRGGAGLGIIEMARRTGRKITYKFVEIDAKTSLFFIQLTLKSGDANEEEQVGKSMLYFENLHNHMMSEKIVVLHKGDFSENSVLPIVQMIENNVLGQDEIRTGKQKLFNVSVELLQNMSLHGMRINSLSEGLFVLTQQDDFLGIGTANYIVEENREELNKLLGNLEKLSKDELNSLYRDKFRLLLDDEVSGVGVGLIYVYRKTLAVNYSFDALGDNLLFSIYAEV